MSLFAEHRPAPRTLGLFLCACLVLTTAFPGLLAQEAQVGTGPVYTIEVSPDGRLGCRVEHREFELLGTIAARDVEKDPRPDVRAQAPLTFDLTLSGFTPDAQAALNFALDIWSASLIGTIPVRMTATFAPLGGNTVGRAGGPVSRDFPGAPLPSTWYALALGDQIGGTDLFPAEFDIDAEFNSTTNWYFGTDGNPGPDEIDFVTVALHELAHGLGFSDSAEATGTPPTGSIGLSGFPIIYDRFLQTGPGTDLLTLGNPSMELGAALTGNDLFFSGASAAAGNGGPAPKLYAPSPFEPGSSIAHLDEATFPTGSENALMTPTITGNEAVHTPGPVTLGLFADLGWNVESVSTLYFAQFGNGSGLDSAVVLVNPTGVSVSGEVIFWDPDGNPINPAAFLPGGTSFNLAPSGTRTFATTGAGALSQGSISVESAFPIGGVVRFNIGGTGIAGVGSSEPLVAAITPARRMGALNTGVAVRNIGDSAIIVDVTLKNEAGNTVASGTTNQMIPGQGRFSMFINELFPGAQTANFSGSVTVRARTGQIGVVALEFEAGAKFTTLPVVKIE